VRRSENAHPFYMTGLFGESCDTSIAWLDPGCLIQNVGTDLGSGVTSLLEPVWIILALVLVVVIIIAFAPNVRHIVPAFL
jgi:hypothetical protein